MFNDNPNKRLSVSETMKRIKERMKDPSVIAAQNALLRQAESSRRFRTVYSFDGLSAYKACRSSDSFEDFLDDLEFKKEDKPKKKEPEKLDPVVSKSTTTIDGREYTNEWRGRRC